ncbi:MAG: UPF0175 family protein [Thermodesulfobacteriota bacterium]
MQVCVEVPDAALAALRTEPEDFIRQVLFLAAARWYEQGRVSQEVAARIAGLDRTDFLLALARAGLDSFP